MGEEIDSLETKITEVNMIKGTDKEKKHSEGKTRTTTGKPGKGDSVLNVPRKAKIAIGKQND